jgi:16S rRNA (guanine(966)-N(2))-methyltransferase RsmD
MLKSGSCQFLERGSGSLLRVISGKLKGKRLFAIKGRNLRPTADRVREAIFDILQGSIDGIRVLDLFAGTGAMGIEALSRGSISAVFVESSRESLNALQRNLAECRLQEDSEVLPLEAEEGIRLLSRRGEEFGLVFLDPPYGRGLVPTTLQALSKSLILSPEALLVAEHSPEETADEIPLLERVDHRKYGGTRVSFFRKAIRNAEPTPRNADFKGPEEN